MHAMRVMMSPDVIGVGVVYDHATKSLTRGVADDVDWFLDGQTSFRVDKSIDDLAAAAGVKLDLVPARPFVEAYRSLGECPPWAEALPSHAFKQFVQSIKAQVGSVLDDVDRRYYDDTFVPVNRFLASLVPPRIDRYRFAALSRRASIESFRPDEDGSSSRVVYDRFGTRTGRLTVKSGPQILTLAKEHRDLLVSRYPGGSIALLDYVSFEAQVALALAGRLPLADVYSAVADDVFTSATDRDIVKRAVLGHLYGMGPAALQQTLNLTAEETRQTMSRLAVFFTGPSSLDDAVARSCVRPDTIVNQYGRVVTLPEGNKRLALNTLVQSTAADAALSGFAAVGQCIIAEQFDITPMFVIHDGLLVDCASHAVSDLDALVEVASVSTGLTGQFPVRIKDACS